MAIPDDKKHLPIRVVRSLYQKVGKSPKYELKGTSLTQSQKVFFAEKALNLLNRHPEIKIWVITVKKLKVQDHIRRDSNKLYNYMLKLLLLERIKHYPRVTLYPDEKSIKVKSGNSLVDYLQTELWFGLNAKTILRYIPLESSSSKNLQFVDYICNIVWNHYERNKSIPFNILEPHITTVPLFFY